MSKPSGDPVQVEPWVSLAVGRKKKGQNPVPIHCGRATCNQLLAYSYGDFLDCFVFTVSHRVRMKCERCGWETRWGPDDKVDGTKTVV